MLLLYHFQGPTIMQQDSTMTESYDLPSALMFPNQMGGFEQTMSTCQPVAQPPPQPMNTTTTLLSDTTRTLLSDTTTTLLSDTTSAPQVISNNDVQIISSGPPQQQTQQLIVSSPLPQQTSDILQQTASIAASPQIINLVLSTDIQQPQLAQPQPILSKPTTFTLFSPLQSLLQGGDHGSNQHQQVPQQPLPPQQHPPQTSVQPFLHSVPSAPANLHAMQSAPANLPSVYEDLSKPKASTSSALRQTHQSDSSLLNKKKDALEPRRASTGSVSSYKTIVPKQKEGPFVIPQVI